jgi:predicted nucleic acid-binding protein
MANVAIFNASPLIVLAKSKHEHLAQVAGDIRLIPSQVVTELSHAGPADPAFHFAKSKTFEVADVQNVPKEIQDEALGPGESGVLSLGLLRPGSVLILDDLAARRAATRMHLTIHGTLWLALEARKRGLIQKVVPVLDDFQRVGMFIEPRLIPLIRQAAGE